MSSGEVGAATLGGRHRPNAALDWEKPPGQRPNDGRTVDSMHIGHGPNQSHFSEPLRTNSQLRTESRRLPLCGWKTSWTLQKMAARSRCVGRSSHTLAMLVEIQSRPGVRQCVCDAAFPCDEYL